MVIQNAKKANESNSPKSSLKFATTKTRKKVYWNFRLFWALKHALISQTKTTEKKNLAKMSDTTASQKRGKR